MSTQFGAGAGQTGHHRTHRQVEPSCDRAGAQLTLKDQLHDFGLLGRQAGDCTVQGAQRKAAAGNWRNAGAVFLQFGMLDTGAPPCARDVLEDDHGIVFACIDASALIARDQA